MPIAHVVPSRTAHPVKKALEAAPGIFPCTASPRDAMAVAQQADSERDLMAMVGPAQAHERQLQTSDNSLPHSLQLNLHLHSHDLQLALVHLHISAGPRRECTDLTDLHVRIFFSFLAYV